MKINITAVNSGKTTITTSIFRSTKPNFKFLNKIKAQLPGLYVLMMPPVGLEPTTHRLRVYCSTN